VQLWDVASRSCTATLTEHASAICCLAFCPTVRAALIESNLSDRGLFRSCRTGRVRSTISSQPSSAQWCGSWSVVTTARHQC
jgi:hypothetical protein